MLSKGHRTGRRVAPLFLLSFLPPNQILGDATETLRRNAFYDRRSSTFRSFFCLNDWAP